jgi:hypothetical protein
MKILKTLFLVMNGILMMNLITILTMLLGFNAIFTDLEVYYRIFVLSGLVSLIFILVNSILNLRFNNLLALNHKARVYFVFMFALYTITFALSQKDASYFMIYAWVNLPVYYFLQAILPHQFDLWMQFGLSIFFIVPSFAISISDHFSQWLDQRLTRSTSK